MTMYSPIFGMDNGSPSTSATNYYPICSTQTSAPSASEADVMSVMSGAFTLDQLTVKLTSAPGAAKSYVITVMKNSVATALTVTLTGAGSGDGITTKTDSVHSVTFAAGDTISLQCVPSGTPTGTGILYWNMRALGTGQPLLGASTTSPSTSSANYSPPMAGMTTNWGTTEALVQMIVPTAGTISNLYVIHKTAPASGKSYAYALMLNGSASALTASVVDAATTATPDTTHSIAVVAGDAISLRSTPSGTPTAPAAEGWGMLFTPTTDGESFFGFGSNNDPGTSAAYEVPWGNGSNFWSASELDVMIGAWTIKKIYVKIGVAPGLAASGKSRTFTVGSAGTFNGPAATILETATTANNATDLTTVQLDLQSVKSTTATTPAGSGGVHHGILIFTTPVGSTSSLNRQPRGLERGMFIGMGV